MARLGALGALVIGRAMTLPPELVAAHPELRAVRFRRGGLAVRVGGWALGRRTVAAITLWRTIFVAPGTRLDPALLLHELGHVRQFEASRSFPLRYVWESLRRGYRRNRFEIDAEHYAVERLRAARGLARTPAGPPAEDV